MQRILLPATILFLVALATLAGCSDPTPAQETLAPAFTPTPTERPTAAPTATPSSFPIPDPTATPAPPRVLAPLQALDSGAMLSELSDTELACIDENPERQTRFFGCLEDETVARIFLAGFVPGPGPAQPRNFRLRPGWVRSHRPQGGHDRRHRGRPGEGHGREHGGALCNDGVPDRPGVGGNCPTGGDGTQRPGGDAVSYGPTGRARTDGSGDESGAGGRVRRTGKRGGGVRVGDGTPARAAARHSSTGAHGDHRSAHTGLHARDNTARNACGNRGNTVRNARDTHSVTDPGTVDSQPDRMPGEFPAKPPVRGNDSDQIQVGSPGLRKDLFGVLLVFSPDVHSEFGSAAKTDSRYDSIQSVEIALPHPDGRHGPVHGASESKYGCVARGQLTVVFNLEVQDRQFLLPGPSLWRHTNPLPSRFMGPEPGSRIPVMTAHQRGNINRCPTGPADDPERGRQPQVRRRERRSARPVSGEAAVSGLLNSMGRGEYIQP